MENRLLLNHLAAMPESIAGFATTKVFVVAFFLAWAKKKAGVLVRFYISSGCGYVAIMPDTRRVTEKLRFGFLPTVTLYDCFVWKQIERNGLQSRQN
jgi:hypothetical protein